MIMCHGISNDEHISLNPISHCGADTVVALGAAGAGRTVDTAGVPKATTVDATTPGAGPPSY